MNYARKISLNILYDVKFVLLQAQMYFRTNRSSNKNFKCFIIPTLTVFNELRKKLILELYN